MSIFDVITNRLDAADERLIRSEAAAALDEAGAISPRIADIFLQDICPTIDPKTGDPVGVREHISAWKSAHKEFFSAPIPATEAEVQTSKPKLVDGLPDLHRLNPRERRAAVSAYRDSLRNR